MRERSPPMTMPQATELRTENKNLSERSVSWEPDYGGGWDPVFCGSQGDDWVNLEDLRLVGGDGPEEDNWVTHRTFI